MSYLNHLLSILDSVDDIVAAFGWDQSLEPAPVRRDDQASEVHYHYHPTEDSKAMIYPKKSEDENRLEEFSLINVFGGDKAIHYGIRQQAFTNDSDGCQCNNNNTITTNMLPYKSHTLENNTAGSPVQKSTASTVNMCHIIETVDNESSAQGNELSQQQHPSLLLSDGVSYAADAFFDSRFRSYQVGQWQERFEELLLFGRSYGHLLVPHCYPLNQKLAQWVKRQRHQYKRKKLGHHSTLSDEREQLLLDAGFVFDSHKAVWNLRFQTLKAFHKVHGHCNIPTDFRDSSLSVWMKHQRRQYLLYQKGLKNTMNEERIQLLDSIGLDWNPRNLVKSYPSHSKHHD